MNEILKEKKLVVINKVKETSIVSILLMVALFVFSFVSSKQPNIMAILFLITCNLIIHFLEYQLLKTAHISDKEFFKYMSRYLKISYCFWGLIFSLYFYVDGTLGNYSNITLISLGIIATMVISNINYKKNDTVISLVLLVCPTVIVFLFSDNYDDRVLAPVFLFIAAGIIAKQNFRYNEEWNKTFDAKNELQMIINTFPGGISIIENNEYTKINRTIVDMTGLNPNKILNHKIGNNNPNDEIVIALGEFEKGDKQVFQKEVGLTIKGEQKTFLLILKKIESFSNKILSITIDIDENKKMRQELDQQKIKLQNSAKLASLGEMASGISHEINNPLQIVGGRAEILREEINDQENLNEDFKNHLLKGLQSIEDMSVRIAKIIKGLKTFARNADNDPMDVCSLDNIVIDTLAFCNQRFQKNNIDFEYSNEYKTALIKGRATQISQVLLNLLNNSYDAIMEKNNDDKFIKLTIEKNKNELVISVIDNGSGIKDSFKEKIMTPFQTTKPIGKGTGLGLSISKGIIEDHGGMLYFDFEKENTTVVIRIPEFVQ